MTNLDQPVAWVNDLHAVASDLRFVASGGQCDPRTLLEHADALLRIVAHPSAAAVSEAYERGRRDALKDLVAKIPKLPSYYPEVNVGFDDEDEESAASEAQP